MVYHVADVSFSFKAQTISTNNKLCDFHVQSPSSRLQFETFTTGKDPGGLKRYYTPLYSRIRISFFLFPFHKMLQYKLPRFIQRQGRVFASLCFQAIKISLRVRLAGSPRGFSKGNAREKGTGRREGWRRRRRRRRRRKQPSVLQFFFFDTGIIRASRGMISPEEEWERSCAAKNWFN